MAPQVVCLGEALIDRIFDRREGQSPEVPFWADHPGGAPANVAVALAKLGTPSALVACLGTDPQGQQVEAALQEAGVDCAALQWTSAHPTRVVLVNRDAQGERTFVGFSLPDPSRFADAYLEAEQIDFASFESAQYLVMGTLGLAYGSLGQSMRTAWAWAKQNGVITVIDLNWRPMFWPQPEQAIPLIQTFLAGVDILKLNREEADTLFQTDQVEAVQARLSAKLVLLTDGAKGCHYATATLSGYVPAYIVDCEDSTGAGDSFLAGFLHQLTHQGMDLLENEDPLRSAVQYASAAGALTATQPGAMTAQPNARAVEAFLYLHNQLMT
ncbi:carbohydrate kinase [Phormidium sp. FACHB-1136]|uniref:carbohydrate kinase family protein n=1 Tax=Phormidium sp. FACHB-1136 TaxID=2692848 RepID=UPI0016825E93|nr:carbohydrate kinase [Phormidium sp. FACHB-1136]MBD2427087.1 carbohydrate kinase [Phormidium sp. FACHB-1136]